MFDLVNDIASYPDYMDGCAGAQVISRSEQEVVARLDLQRGPLAVSFTTRNLLEQPVQIKMQLEEGPFRQLAGAWGFKALTESACKVSLDLEFEFNNASIALASSGLFSSVANQLVKSVCDRANKVYRKPL